MARQLAVTAAAWLLGGGPAVAVQLTSALVACTYFIIVEYLQHYGLERATLENGRCARGLRRCGQLGPAARRPRLGGGLQSFVTGWLCLGLHTC